VWIKVFPVPAHPDARFPASAAVFTELASLGEKSLAFIGSARLAENERVGDIRTFDNET
jgi:hypothetical protein